MSTLIISWDDEKIVEIEKRGELFYSSVNYENVLRAIQSFDGGKT